MVTQSAAGRLSAISKSNEDAASCLVGGSAVGSLSKASTLEVADGSSSTGLYPSWLNKKTQAGRGL